MSTDLPAEDKAVRQPSLLDALIPLLFMIGLLATSIVLFGLDAAVGPLQVALLMSAVVAAVVAHKNGHSWETLGEEIVKGISLAMSAILILLMVGALIGVWNMSGTIATMVYYGVKYIDPSWFYLAAALLCGIVGIVTGSSWTTAATLGVAFIGMANAIGASTAITAGAVISGAYFGDKMTPLSETTILTPQIVGSDVYTHIASMAKATIPAYLISLVIFFFIGKVNEISATVDTTATLQALESSYNISLWNLLPVLVLMLLGLRKYPAFLSILIGTLVGALVAVVMQPQVVAAFANDPSLGYGLAALEECVDGHGQRLYRLNRIRADRYPVLGRRHGQHADDYLVDPGSDVLWRHDGLWRLQRPPDHAGHQQSQIRRRHDRCGDGHLPGIEHRCRRPVYRHRAAGAHVHGRVPQARCSPGNPGNRGRKLRHGHFSADTLEFMRCIHVGCPGSVHVCVPALLLLQLPEFHPGHVIWFLRDKRHAVGSG